MFEWVSVGAGAKTRRKCMVSLSALMQAGLIAAAIVCSLLQVEALPRPRLPSLERRSVRLVEPPHTAVPAVVVPRPKLALPPRPDQSRALARFRPSTCPSCLP
jgi:hypothetical protein